MSSIINNSEHPETGETLQNLDQLIRLSDSEGDCSDGRPVAENYPCRISTETAPIRSFGGFQGIVLAITNVIVNNNSGRLSTIEDKQIIATQISDRLKKILGELGLTFDGHTAVSQMGEGFTAYAGCAHINGNTNLNEIFKMVMDLMVEDKELTIQTPRKGDHVEKALIVTTGNFTMKRDGVNQFFTIDGKVASVMYKMLKAWNADVPSQLFIDGDALMEEYIKEMLDTSDKLVTSQDTPIYYMDTGSVEETSDGLHGTVPLLRIPSTRESLGVLLNRVFTSNFNDSRQ